MSEFEKLRYTPVEKYAIGVDFGKSKDDDFIDVMRYFRNDIDTTTTAYDRYCRGMWNKKKLEIKKVIFNDPATIVFWSDGAKTVVKCDKETFDPEKGLAMAIAKKFLGNQGNYYNEFKKWLPELQETEVTTLYADGNPVTDILKDISDGITRAIAVPKDKLGKEDLVDDGK